MKSVTLGQYYPIESKIHSLDARVKLIGVIIFIISLFVATNFLAYGIVGIFLYFCIKLAKLPLKFVIKGVRALGYVIVFTMVVNVIFSPGEIILLDLGFFNITLEAVLWGILITLRFVLLIISSSLLTLTTSPINLTGAIETLLSPFKKIKLPVHEIAMMMTIALRFIPTLMEETDKITKAQMSRGAEFDSGSIAKRVKSLIPILIPLFVSAFRRADDLAMAMEARCYRGDINRTKLKELRYTKNDVIAYAIMFIFLLLVILTNFIYY
ncbi:MAG: energy-coupling factor transporter transmembrane protein EcfT [Defluviitaleaceae bacterium]|nr:energy-coupling factor transporter transmembrane protein EcfT [Defluviitaleaceae bacterium]